MRVYPTKFASGQVSAKKWALMRTWSNRPIPGLAAQATRLRKSPYFERTVDWGVADFTVYNRMLMPLGYGNPQTEYRALTQDVAIWDVAAERQVELKGPDAFKLAQFLTPRNLSSMRIGKCAYAIMTDNEGIVINDPVLLKLAEDRFWFSIADSDVLLWAKAMGIAKGLDVQVYEPDVSPLAVQGPKSKDLVRDLFGAHVVDDIKHFHFKSGEETVLDGDIHVVLARSGWSPELGYELYLTDGTQGSRLWDLVMDAGRKYNIACGAPNQSRRMEAGMLSFGGDTLPDTNALELGLAKKYVNPHAKHEFVGKEALQRIKEEGVQRRFVGLMFEGDRRTTISLAHLWRGQHHPVFLNEEQEDSCGYLTAIEYSPKFNRTLGMGFISNSVPCGESVHVIVSHDTQFNAQVTALPFDIPPGQGVGSPVVF